MQMILLTIGVAKALIHGECIRWVVPITARIVCHFHVPNCSGQRDPNNQRVNRIKAGHDRI